MLNRIIIIMLMSIGFLANAQNTSTSPYSSYGFGEKGGFDHAVFSGLGNSTITYFDSTVLNFYNPASYNTIGKGQPLFSTGISSRLSSYTSGSTNHFSKVIALDHFALGFSFAKHLGITFGLKPFSRRGYEFQTKQALGNEDNDTMKYSYSGRGVINEPFIGFSSNIIKLTNHQLAVGANLGYLFGTVTNERRSQTNDALAGAVDQDITRLNALHYEIGSYYSYTINASNSLTLSAVIEPTQNLKAEQEQYLIYSSNVNNPLFYDTTNSEVSGKGSISLATSNTIGFNYVHRLEDPKQGSKTRSSEIGFHGSYQMTNWQNYRTEFDGLSSVPEFKNTRKLTFGVQYIPETSFLEKAVTTKFFEKLRYRAGFYHYTLPLSVDGNQINDFGTTFGIGIPVLSQQTLSSINIGLTYGKRGSSSAGSLSENYGGINVGIILAPAIHERWFKKRKLD
jgi:hypothetical protein